MRYLPGLLSLLLVGVVVGGVLAACQTISGTAPLTQNPDSANCPVPSGPIALAQPEVNVTVTLNRPAIDSAVYTRTEVATFALGWFWGSDSRFGSVPGVVRTRVGYTGGTTLNPDYENIGDHTESVEVEFDPTQVTYEQLLEVFFQGHDATEKPWLRQYMSAIFFSSEEQRQVAKTYIAREEARLLKGKIYTQVLPVSTFYPAEDYHQKFYLKFEDDLVNELRAAYPDFVYYVRSTAVARINGFIRGYGDTEVLHRELPSYGLSAEAGEKLLKLATE